MKIIVNDSFEITYDETKAEQIKKDLPDYIRKEKRLRKRLFTLKVISFIATLGLLISTFVLVQKDKNYAGLLIPFILLAGFSMFLKLYDKAKFLSNKEVLNFENNYAKNYIDLINYLKNYRLISVVETWGGFIFSFIDENEYVYKITFDNKCEKYYTIRQKYKDNKTKVIDLTTFDWKKDLEKIFE